MIITKNSHRMIKILYPGAETNKIRCISKNDLYPPVEIKFEDIDRIFLVKGRIARNAI